MEGDQTSSVGVRLARATIVALHGSVGVAAGEPERSIVLLPDMRPVTSATADAKLASMTKPVVCVAIWSQGQLHIAAWSVPGPLPVMPDLLEMVRETFREPSEVAAGETPKVSVVSDGGGHKADLTCAEYERWIQEHRLPLSTINVGPAVSSDLPLSASFVARVKPPSEDSWIEFFT